MLFNELPISFPWYEKIEQQWRYTENAAAICDFRMISPFDALLPFEFWRESGGNLPAGWEVYEVNSQVQVANLTPSISLLRPYIVEGKEYYIYDGSRLVPGGVPLNLAPGWYYSRISWADGTFRFSEVFHVPDADGFSILNEETANWLKLEWYNDSDIAPLFYSARAGGLPYFRNVLYLDTFIVNSEPEITVDGTKDGNDDVVPTFQKATINYRITLAVPDFIKKALMVMSIHDHIVITTQRGIRSGEIESPAVAGTSLEGNGAITVVDIVFPEGILLKKACGENMVSAPAVLA